MFWIYRKVSNDEWPAASDEAEKTFVALPDKPVKMKMLNMPAEGGWVIYVCSPVEEFLNGFAGFTPIEPELVPPSVLAVFAGLRRYLQDDDGDDDKPEEQNVTKH